MSKAIPIIAIAVAFVAGTLVSSVVYADEKNGKPFEDGDKQGWVVTFSTSSGIPRAVNVHAICATP